MPKCFHRCSEGAVAHPQPSSNSQRIKGRAPMRSHFHVTRAMALVLMLSAAGITAASDRNSRLGGSARVTRGHEVVVFRRQRERHPFTSSFLSPDRRRGRGRPLHARFRPCTMDRRAFARHRARIVAGRLGGPPEDGDHEQSDLHSIHYMEKVGPPAAREHHPGEQPAAFGVLAGVPSSAPFSSSWQPCREELRAGRCPER